MAGFFGNILGTGLALLPLAVALLLVRHRHHLQRLHKSAPRWLLVIAIALMVLAGSLFAFVGIGSWVISALTWIQGEIGSAGPVIFAIVALALLIKVIIGLVSEPDEAVMGAAFFAPVLFAMFSVGLFAKIDAFLQPLAHQVASGIGSFLGA